MKENELIRYTYGRNVDKAVTWLSSFRNRCEAHLKTVVADPAMYWVLHSKVNGTSSQITWIEIEKSLLRLVDKQSPEMVVTVDAIGRIRIHVEEAFGTEVTSIYLLTSAMLNALTKCKGSSEKEDFNKQIRLLEVYWSNFEVHADWLGDLVVVPTEEEHVIADALGQFW